MAPLKIASITAGAAGMYCGSCMKDNTLAAALGRVGHDCVLVPTYTPIRTDEEDVSQHRVFLGGINVYLQQKSWLFRHTPRLINWALDRPGLLRWVSRFAVKTDGSKLGDLTVSMLQGSAGNQKGEIETLVRWLKDEFAPDVVLLSNVLISGIVPAMRAAGLGPIVATLQGDDIFLEMLPPADRARCIALIQQNGQAVDGYIATSHYYADFMADYLGLSRERIDVVPPGIDIRGMATALKPAPQTVPTIGFFARVCPEKGFHQIVEAFRRLRTGPRPFACRLRASGWLGENTRPYFEEWKQRMASAGIIDDFEYVDSPTHADKVRFLQSVDVLSVPTVYREPKGIYLLEAMACGVPVVQPAHGAFPEVIEGTGGGELVPADDPAALADGLRRLLDDAPRRAALGEAGRKAVLERFTAEAMARQTADVLRRHYDNRKAGRTAPAGRSV